jgi:molybdate transport system ATP-binding protein
MTGELSARFEKRFPRSAVVTVDLRQRADGFNVTVLFGPSGCGKTTALRCLAGLERPQRGRIEFQNDLWFDDSRRVFRLPQQRDVGFLFQDYALFPHLTVAENIGYGLSKSQTSQRRRIVADMLARFQISELAGRYPHQISGGQQQRVALARVLACRPRLLLLDEPLSALDEALRNELRRQLRDLLAEFAIPVILVTHDRVEAMSLGDRIAVMEGGSIRQEGTIADVFSRPVDLTVARIAGIETIQPGSVLGVDNGLAAVQVGPTQLLAVAPEGIGKQVHVCIKGEDVSLMRGPRSDSSVRNQFSAVVRWISPEGPLLRVGLDGGFEFTALITRPAMEELQLHVGQTVTAGIKAPSIHLLPTH